MFIILLFLIILILLLKYKIKIEKFNSSFDDVLNTHCFSITNGEREDYEKTVDSGICKTSNCPFEYCNELVPGTQQYVMKKQRQLLIDGKCVSKNNGTKYKCNRLPIPSDDANTCDSTNHCFEFRNGVWEKDFYRKELDDNGNCNWKNIKTNQVQNQEYLDTCLKNKFTCYQYNKSCPSSSKIIRFGLDSSDSSGMTCKEINNCDTCEAISLTCEDGKTYTQKNNFGECNFYDDLNRQIPNTCDGIQRKLNCKDTFDCNDVTYSPIDDNQNSCVYESSDGKKMYTDKCIPQKKCNTWQFLDLVTDTCSICPSGTRLINNKGKSVDEACGTPPSCSGQFDTCYEVQNGTHVPRTYPYTFKNGSCSSNKPRNCQTSRPVIRPPPSPSPPPPPASSPPSGSVDCQPGYKEVSFRGRSLCIWTR